MICIALLTTAWFVFLEGSLSSIVFLGLVLFLGLWGRQAVHAYSLAVRRGSRPGGQIQILALAPLAIVVLTGFWLEAGGAATPAASLERYVSAWHAHRADIAAPLFSPAQDETSLARQWAHDEEVLRAEIVRVVAVTPAAADLDPEQPFESIQFLPLASGADSGRAAYAVTIVHREQREGTFFGLFPAARQELVEDARVGTIELRLLPRGPGSLEGLDHVWRIESVSVQAPGI